MATVPTTVFTYGGYSLPHAKTESYKYETVMDPSNTNVMYTRHTLQIRGILYPGIAPSRTGETAWDCFNRIRHEFARNRRPLLYAQNKKVVIEIATGDIDCENGPKAISFDPVLITQESVTVIFTVIVCTVDCSASTASRRGWSSNTWTETEDYNKTGLCTLTTHGTLIVAGDLRRSPDQFRHIMAPRIRNGYQRERSSYTLSPDGLRMEYTFVDQEFDVSPPYGALDARGVFMIIRAGARWMAQCTVSLHGKKSVPKQNLMVLAAEIVFSKLRSVAPPQVSSGGLRQEPVTTHAYFKEQLYENAVEISFQCSILPETLGTARSGPRYNLFGTELPGSPAAFQPGVAPPLRGNNEFLTMLAAAFDDPCVTTAYVAAGLTSAELRGGAGGFEGELRGGTGP